MSNRRLLSALTLVAFLPLAIGCSSTRTTSMQDDASEAERMLGSGKPVDVSAVIDRTGKRHEWEGTVRLVSPDVLEFSREAYTGQPAKTVRLARQDVQAFESTHFSGGKTTLLVVGTLAAFIAVEMVWIASSLDFHPSLGSGGGYRGY